MSPGPETLLADTEPVKRIVPLIGAALTAVTTASAMTARSEVVFVGMFMSFECGC